MKRKVGTWHRETEPGPTCETSAKADQELRSEFRGRSIRVDGHMAASVEREISDEVSSSMDQL